MADYASKNRDHFDKTATTYDSKPWMQRAAAQITAELRLHRDWLGITWASTSSKNPPVGILDYACGTGMITRAFAPYATHITGIDISSAMVAEYNRRCASTENPLGASMHAIEGDLCDPAGVAEALAGEELFGFDMAVVGMGFHHFEHLELSVRRLVERVRMGGVVVVVDFAEGSGVGEGMLGGDEMGGGHVHGDGHRHGRGRGGKSDHIHGAEHAPPEDTHQIFASAAPYVPQKHGFSRAAMETLFSAAGCTDFDFLFIAEPIVFGDGEDLVRKRAFVARARRGA